VNYTDEAYQLDAEIFTVIQRWHDHDEDLPQERFNDLALRIFAHQLRYNEPYARYCETQGVTLERLPDHWEAIPPVPSAGESGHHYMENGKLYDAALLAGFDRFMLPDHVRLRYLNLVPNPAQQPHSSLGYMMARVSERRGDGATSWYLDGERFNIEALIGDLEAAVDHDRPVCIATTAFALVHVLDALYERHRYFALPSGSRLMETGGFKGRSRVVDRDDLYARTAERFGMTNCAIVAEYGMTELTSQYYDDVLVRGHDHSIAAVRYKLSPPWLRPRVVGPDGVTLPNGIVGALAHVDLGNRASCVAIQTEDLGVQFDEGLVLIGRESGAALRGCSLSAEELLVR